MVCFISITATVAYFQDFSHEWSTGKTLALQEFRITLTMLVLNFKFGAPPGELASLAAHQRILRVPRYCYFRLTAL